jgi:hypothetical protein
MICQSVLVQPAGDLAEEQRLGALELLARLAHFFALR